jgi:hypothetical protein
MWENHIYHHFTVQMTIPSSAWQSAEACEDKGRPRPSPGPC